VRRDQMTNDKHDPISSPASVSANLNERLAGEFDSISNASLQPTPSVAPEIALDQLRAADRLVILTLNSVYTFLVNDPVNRKGLLSGGVIGNDAVQAVLEVASSAQDHRLRTGERVRFYIISGPSIKRVTTSVVTNLIHRRSGKAAF